MTISACDPMTYLVRAVLRRESPPMTRVRVLPREDGSLDIHIAYPPAVYTVDGPVPDDHGRSVYFGANVVIVCLPAWEDEDGSSGCEEWRLLSV